MNVQEGPIRAVCVCACVRGKNRLKWQAIVNVERHTSINVNKVIIILVVGPRIFVLWL
jgi:hypothetical protein